MKKGQVIAVVPNYNMARGLKVLLPQLILEKYDKIYVLDDASKDDSARVVAEFKDVIFIQGTTNVGAGANRNRILDYIDDGSIVHFLDADVVLKTEKVVEKIDNLVRTYPNAVIGGMIVNKSEEWHEFNFGPRGSKKSFVGVRVHWLSVQLKRNNYNKSAVRLRKVFDRYVSDWPNIINAPQPKQVFWVTEGNLIIPGRIFKQLNGFNPTLREHEILEFGMRMQKNNLKVYFDPSIVVKHIAIRVRPRGRAVKRAKDHLKVLSIHRGA